MTRPETLVASTSHYSNSILHQFMGQVFGSRMQQCGFVPSLRFAATPDSFSAYLLREKGSATKLESASLFAGELNTSPASAIRPDQPRCSVPKRSAGASLRCEERLAQTLLLRQDGELCKVYLASGARRQQSGIIASVDAEIAEHPAGIVKRGTTVL